MGDSLLLRRVDPTSGVELTLYNMLVNVRLCVGQPGANWYDRGWCYDKTASVEASMALLVWDGVGIEPPGPWSKDTHRQIWREPHERGGEWFSGDLVQAGLSRLDPDTVEGQWAERARMLARLAADAFGKVDQ